MSSDNPENFFNEAIDADKKPCGNGLVLTIASKEEGTGPENGEGPITYKDIFDLVTNSDDIMEIGKLTNALGIAIDFPQDYD